MFGICTLLRFARKVRAKPLLWLFRSVRTSAFLAVLDALGVKLAAHYLVSQVHVLHTAAAKEHHCMFLQCVSHAGNVGRHFHAVGEPDAGNFANGGVGLARRLGRYFSQHAALERRVKINRPVFEDVERVRQSRRLGLVRRAPALAADELVDGRHKEKSQIPNTYFRKSSDFEY